MWRAAVCAFACALLAGCGNSGQDTTPPPPGYSPTTLAQAWQNHVTAFTDGDVERIKLDFDGASIVNLWNDYSPETSAPSDAKRYNGLSEIGGFYTQMFQDLATRQGFTQRFINQTDEAEGKITLWVWDCAADGFDGVSVTTIFGSNLKVQVQHVTITSSTRFRPSSARRLDQERATMAGRNSSSSVTAITAREAPEVLNANPVDVQHAVGEYTTALTRRDLWGGPPGGGPYMNTLYSQASGALIEHYEWLTGGPPDPHKWLKGVVYLGDFYTTDSSRNSDSLYVRLPDPTNFQQRHLFVNEDTKTAFLVWDSLPGVYSSVSMTLLYDNDKKIIMQTAVTRAIQSQETKSMMMV